MGCLPLSKDTHSDFADMYSIFIIEVDRHDVIKQIYKRQFRDLALHLIRL